jgi:hypothetical protein
MGGADRLGVDLLDDPGVIQTASKWIARVVVWHFLHTLQDRRGQVPFMNWSVSAISNCSSESSGSKRDGRTSNALRRCRRRSSADRSG